MQTVVSKSGSKNHDSSLSYSNSAEGQREKGPETQLAKLPESSAFYDYLCNFTSRTAVSCWAGRKKANLQVS